MQIAQSVIILLLTTECILAGKHGQRSRKKSKSKVPDKHGTDQSKQIEDMFRAHSYELSIRPKVEGQITKVGLGVMIESITDVSEKNMDFTLTLCLHETWVDPRLRFSSGGKGDSIVLPSRLIDKIWVPDIYIVGSKNSFIHKTTVNNVVLRLYSNGTIYYSVKITSTVACQMNLYNFPLDLESCSLTFQSLGYNNKEVVMEWVGGKDINDLFFDPGLVTSMPKFRLIHHQFLASNQSDSASYNAENKSSLQVMFELKRYPLSFFLQSYFPAMSMVTLAGLGMWIDPRSVPARVALGVTSVLTIATIITGMKSSLPKVSYLTAMDIYLWVCFLFVFATVLQFCALNYFMKRQQNRKARIHRTSAKTSFESWRKKICCFSDDPAALDIFFRLGYFITFLLFNVAYWVYYVILTYHDV
uniref:Gamma-aminobutyric acid receptor subunit rho-2 n=1 Tax=Phallusia mammillata TaxID=59560 RepID=A0A6F9DDI1_9ASCI|nr:gamma-aminobutyric acid receptor subunit rho-2 [Phallusia mammillata]